MRNLCSAFARLGLILVLTLAVSGVFGQGIEFYKGTFEEAKSEAKAKDKLIFVDAYAAWCGPCKRMARSVFPNEDLGEFFNDNFINMKIDAEKGMGRNFARTYNVSAYPTLFFLDGNGAVVSRLLGARNVSGLIREGKKALQGGSSALKAFKQQYEKGDRSASFLFKYLNALNSAEEDYEFVFAEYLTTQSTEEKQAAKNVELIYELTNSVISPGYPYLMQIEPQVIERKGIEKYHSKLKMISNNSVALAANTADEELYDNAQSLLKEKDIPEFKRDQLENAMTYHELTKDWKPFAKASRKYVKSFASEDADQLHLLASKFYENLERKRHHKKALKWSAKAVQLEDNFKNNDLYAHILFQLGDIEKAKDAAERAIQLGKVEKVNYRKTQNLLLEIKKAQAPAETLR